MQLGSVCNKLFVYLIQSTCSKNISLHKRVVNPSWNSVSKGVVSVPSLDSFRHLENFLGGTAAPCATLCGQMGDNIPAIS